MYIMYKNMILIPKMVKVNNQLVHEMMMETIKEI